MKNGLWLYNFPGDPNIIAFTTFNTNIYFNFICSTKYINNITSHIWISKEADSNQKVSSLQMLSFSLYLQYLEETCCFISQNQAIWKATYTSLLVLGRNTHKKREKIVLLFRGSNNYISRRQIKNNEWWYFQIFTLYWQEETNSPQGGNKWFVDFITFICDKMLISMWQFLSSL